MGRRGTKGAGDVCVNSGEHIIGLGPGAPQRFPLFHVSQRPSPATASTGMQAAEGACRASRGARIWAASPPLPSAKPSVMTRVSSSSQAALEGVHTRMRGLVCAGGGRTHARMRLRQHRQALLAPTRGSRGSPTPPVNRLPSPSHPKMCMGCAAAVHGSPHLRHFLAQRGQHAAGHHLQPQATPKRRVDDKLHGRPMPNRLS